MAGIQFALFDGRVAAQAPANVFSLRPSRRTASSPDGFEPSDSHDAIALKAQTYLSIFANRYRVRIQRNIKDLLGSILTMLIRAAVPL